LTTADLIGLTKFRRFQPHKTPLSSRSTFLDNKSTSTKTRVPPITINKLSHYIDVSLHDVPTTPGSRPRLLSGSYDHRLSLITHRPSHKKPPSNLTWNVIRGTNHLQLNLYAAVSQPPDLHHHQTSICIDLPNSNSNYTNTPQTHLHTQIQWYLRQMREIISDPFLRANLYIRAPLPLVERRLYTHYIFYFRALAAFFSPPGTTTLHSLLQSFICASREIYESTTPT